MNVDVDWMDREYIKTMPERLNFVPHDQTSNQLWVDVELHQERSADILRQAAEELEDKGWLHIYTRAVRPCCVIKYCLALEQIPLTIETA